MRPWAVGLGRDRRSNEGVRRIAVSEEEDVNGGADPLISCCISVEEDGETVMGVEKDTSVEPWVVRDRVRLLAIC